MKKMKKIFAGMLVFILLFTSVNAVAGEVQNFDAANKLRILKLFIGSSNGFELDKKFTREQSVIMVLRLMGLERKAKGEGLKAVDFDDVPTGHWAEAYIAYAKKIGLTKGVSDYKFGLGSSVTTNQYMTFVMRALEYEDRVDFNWNNPYDKAQEIGLLSSTEVKYYKSKADVDMLRDDVVALSYNAIKTKIKDRNKTLLMKLVDSGAVTISEVNDTNDSTLINAVASPTPKPNTATPTPTATPSPTPSHLSAYSKIEAESFNECRGVEIGSASEGGRDVEWIEDEDYIKFNNIDFSNVSPKTFEARIASGASGGSIEVRLDGLRGKYLGTLTFGSTDGWQDWETKSANFSASVSGVHDLYLIFTGGKGSLFALNWFRFYPSEPISTYSDNFNDGKFDGWTTYNGTWAVTNSQLSVNPGSEAKAIVTNSNYSNFTYKADVSIGTSGAAGLIFRVSSPGLGEKNFNGYYVGIDANEDVLELGEISNGKWYSIDDYDDMKINPFTTYHLKVIANKSDIKVYLEDMNNPKIDESDSTYSTGAIGVRAVNTHAYFDNVYLSLDHDVPTPSPTSTPSSYRDPEDPKYSVNGLEYYFYEDPHPDDSRAWDRISDFIDRDYDESGTVKNFDVRAADEETDIDENYGLVFKGYVNIEEKGKYTFYLRSDDGSRLYIGDSLLIDHDGLHDNGSEKTATINLDEGKHLIKVIYFNNSGSRSINVSYSGPRINKTTIPDSKLFRKITPTSTPRPTSTPIPTHTPKPTHTPEPTDY